MGLFDFLKSTEQRKKDELMKKMNNEIFPNGQIQMDREVQEVRQLLGFRYTREAIRETYIYASALYFMSDNKDIEDIVPSVLRNPSTSVTKDDAIKMYEYIHKKFSVKARNQLAQKLNNQTDSQKLFMIAKGGIVELKNAFKELPEKGKFEVIIFNSLLILQQYHEKYPEKYEQTSDGYFTLLFKQAAEYKISIPVENLRSFINSRFAFYLSELEEQADNDLYLQTKVYSNFYEKPLLNEPVDSDDIFAYTAFLPAYYQMIGWVRKKISIL